MSIKIAFFDTKPYDKEIFDSINKNLGYEIKYYKFHLNADNAILAKDYNVVIAFVNDTIDEATIEKLYGYGIKVIALRCAGFNNVDLKAAKDKIKVVRVPEYSPHAIAEHSVALMLTLNRKIHRAYYRTREANFALNGLMGFDFHGKIAGVIGTGRIGKELIKILRGFGMNILAHDVHPDKEFEEAMGFEYVGLENLFAQSDVISLNCPLTKETKYLINRHSIERMKTGVMIINTGRGKLINTSDLIAGLKSGKIGWAGLDVYEEESEYFFEDLSNQVLTDDVLARLLTFNNVIITAHQGFFTKEALQNIAVTTMNNIRDFIEGNELKNEVTYQG